MALHMFETMICFDWHPPTSVTRSKLLRNQSPNESWIINLFQLDVAPATQFQVPITEQQRVILVHFTFMFYVARKRVRLGDKNDLLESSNLRADVKQLHDFLVVWRRVALHTEHLDTTALFTLPSHQHLSHQTVNYQPNSSPLYDYDLWPMLWHTYNCRTSTA